MVIDEIKQLSFLITYIQAFSYIQQIKSSYAPEIGIDILTLDAALLPDGGAPGKVEGVDGLVGLYQAGGGPAETRAGGGGQVRGKRDI